jgi:hypothetical protein
MGNSFAFYFKTESLPLQTKPHTHPQPEAFQQNSRWGLLET